MDIISEYKFCPKCGSELHSELSTSGKTLYSICKNSKCRTFIKGNIVDVMDIDIYSRLQCKFEYKDSGYFMLLKENLSGPLLVKNTNNALEKCKNTLCIIEADSKQDAANKFKDKFKYIKISEDMIVPIRIVEV